VDAPSAEGQWTEADSAQHRHMLARQKELIEAFAGPMAGSWPGALPPLPTSSPVLACSGSWNCSWSRVDTDAGNRRCTKVAAEFLARKPVLGHWRWENWPTW